MDRPQLVKMCIDFCEMITSKDSLIPITLACEHGDQINFIDFRNVPSKDSVQSAIIEIIRENKPDSICLITESFRLKNTRAAALHYQAQLVITPNVSLSDLDDKYVDSCFCLSYESSDGDFDLYFATIDDDASPRTVGEWLPISDTYKDGDIDKSNLSGRMIRLYDRANNIYDDTIQQDRDISNDKSLGINSSHLNN